MEPGQQGARVLLYMPVVLGYQLHQQSHLFLLHSLDQEPVVLRQEEGTARLARRRQQAQRSLTGQRQQVVHVVNAEQLPEALEDQRAVVFPLEAAAVVAAQVLADLVMGRVGSAQGEAQHGRMFLYCSTGAAHGGYLYIWHMTTEAGC